MRIACATVGRVGDRAYNIELGRYLWRLLQDAGYDTQRQISAATGIEQDIISRDLRAGRPRGIRQDRLEAYANLLRVNLKDVEQTVTANLAATSDVPAELAEKIRRATELVEDQDDAREIAELLTRQYYRHNAQVKRRGA